MDASDASSPPPRRPRSLNWWLAGSVIVLAAAVVVLAVLLARQDSLSSSAPKTPATASRKAGASADADGGRKQGAAARRSPRPYIAVPGPGAPRPPKSPGAKSPGSGPLAGVLRNFGSMMKDPDLKRTLRDLQQQLQKSMGSLGKLFGGLPGGLGPSSPQPPHSPPSADPFSDLLNQALRMFGMRGQGGHGRRPPADDPHRIEAVLKDTGAAFVVRCRFPGQRPESASFRLEGQTLVIKARFPGGEDREKKVALPAPVNQLGARSELKRGQLVVTLPKAT